jgi:hypothetical protein
MRRRQSRSMTAILRAWLASKSEEEWDGIAQQVVEQIVNRALEGEFGYFKLLLDVVDGPIPRGAKCSVIEADCTIILADVGQSAKVPKAA